jgi:hypothetical protein
MPDRETSPAGGRPTSRSPARPQPKRLHRAEPAVRPMRFARQVPMPTRTRRPDKDVRSAQQPNTAMVTTDTMLVTQAPCTALQPLCGRVIRVDTNCVRHQFSGRAAVRKEVP